MSDGSSDQICGVDKDILERFLSLVRDRYPEVDKANYFLETNLGTSGINIAITNQRDVLSHLVTILTQLDMSREEKIGHIANAEEHLRRAVFESYEKGLAIMADKVLNLYEKYKTTVLPLRNPTLSSAPDLTSLGARFRTIRELRVEGRAMKARNRWDDKWEEGVKKFIVAFNQLKDLEHTLEEYIIRATQIHESKKTKHLTWWGIVTTITTTILGMILAYVLFQRSSTTVSNPGLSAGVTKP